MARAKGTGKLFDEVQQALSAEQPAASETAGNDHATLVIDSGPQLTIETIGDFAARLRAALSESDRVAVALPQEVELDITALQLFCAACKTAGAAGKSFSLQDPLPEELQRLVAASGSDRHEHCAYDSSACFRKIGGTEQWPS